MWLAAEMRREAAGKLAVIMGNMRVSHMMVVRKVLQITAFINGAFCTLCSSSTGTNTQYRIIIAQKF